MRVQPEPGIENVRHERAGRIDDGAGTNLAGRALSRVSRVARQASPSRRAETSFVRTRMSAPRSAASRALSATRRLSSTQQSEYTKAVSKPGLRALPAGWRGEVDRLRARQAFARRQVVVKEEAEAHEPGRADALLVRQDETQRPDDVGRRFQQPLALEQRLAHQAELVIFEISQAAMDQLGAGRGGVAGEVGLLAQNHGQAAADGVARDPGAVDAAAHDKKIG